MGGCLRKPVPRPNGASKPNAPPRNSFFYVFSLIVKGTYDGDERQAARMQWSWRAADGLPPRLQVDFFCPHARLQARTGICSAELSSGPLEIP